MADLGEVRGGPKWGEGGRRNREAGEKSAFGEGGVGDTFAEVLAGGLFDTIGGPTVWDLVEVHFEDLIFGVLSLGLEGKNDLFEFAGHSTLRGEERVFDKLLGNSAPTLEGGSAGSKIKGTRKVVDGGASDAGEIDTGVRVEVFVFGSQGGAFDVFGE